LGSRALPPLGQDEKNDANPEDDQECDHTSGVPRLGDASPLHGKKIADHTGKDDCSSEKVHLQDFLLPSGVNGLRGRRGLEEYENDNRRAYANRQIYVEAELLVSRSNELIPYMREAYHHRQLT
jgi:hypothetical protein